jgi:hypothetical protein
MILGEAIMSEYVVTFDPRPIVGAGALAGLRRMTLAEARETAAVAARIPKVGRIIDAETLAEYSPTPAGPENCGTIWVCQDCLMHHANGECGSCHDEEHGHDREPLSAIEAPFTVAMGMMLAEHAEGCLFRELASRKPRKGDPAIDGYGCDCETDTYSTSQCEGCGSQYHGERHAMTLFKN